MLELPFRIFFLKILQNEEIMLNVNVNNYGSHIVVFI